MAVLPRSEHPRPQFIRRDWLNLNGTWTYAFDLGRSGHERGLPQAEGFDRDILVPFCPESERSGVGHKDFIDCMWYHREIEIPSEWNGKRILLHFGGVDYECEAFIDGVSVGRHFGGSSSFTFDVTRRVSAGKSHNLVVYVLDETRSGVQPGGKQSHRYHSHGCHYTRTTGIWQTVWLEAVSPFGLETCHIVPDFDGGAFLITPSYFAVGPGMRLRARVFDNGGVGIGDQEGATGALSQQGLGEQVSETVVTQASGVPLALPIHDPTPWEPGNPYLYPLLLEVTDEAGNVHDTVFSYAGLRKVEVRKDQVYLNNRPIYLRLVLDQGFYPDGIWTAPSDGALKRDIELSIKAGFNGARLHQKVFEERFHYWADRLGYLTWGESASWGMDVSNPVGARNFLSEWWEIVVRDRNHPSIIAWTPFNETAHIRDKKQHNRLHADAYDLTRNLDPTRPVNDASGYCHVKTDLWTVHTYTQDPAELKEQLTPKADSGVFRNFPDREVEYSGQPYLVDEFGGIKWVPPERRAEAADAWGYGEGPKTLDEFFKRLEGQVRAVVGLPHICGFCYTQLTDVEQEQNGIYNYDRTAKFDMKRVREIFQMTQDSA